MVQLINDHSISLLKNYVYGYMATQLAEFRFCISPFERGIQFTGGGDRPPIDY